MRPGRGTRRKCLVHGRVGMLLRSRGLRENDDLRGTLEDEEDHIDFLETQLDLINRIGKGRCAQLNATEMDAVE